MSQLESETGRLRRQAADKDRLITDLQEKVSRFESTSQTAEARLRAALQENDVLSKERDSLAVAAKKLARDLTKLESFKRHLVQSLSDDNHSQTETVDVGPCDQSVVSSSRKEPNDKSIGAPPSKVVGGSSETATRPNGQKLSITPWLTPNGTPKTTSTAVSPKNASSATSPTKARVEAYPTMSPWYPSSQRSSAANSPPRVRPFPGQSPRVDGKEFFRQARSRLSYEQFGAFLANIKELNSQKQSREETMRKAEEIFGTENRDLYVSFQGLLSRNLRA